MATIVGAALVAIGVLPYLVRAVDWMIVHCREPLISLYSLVYDRERLEKSYGEGGPFLRLAFPGVFIPAGVTLLLWGL